MPEEAKVFNIILRTTNMQLSTRLARIIFVSIACILLIFSYSLYIQVKDLISSYRQINDTNIVQLKLEQTLSTFKDAETAQRGFLLTEDSLFLQPYEGAYERSKRLISELHVLVGDNAEQVKSLNAMATFGELRFSTFQSVIRQYNSPDINAETRKSHLLKGKSATDSISFYANKILDVESAILKEKERIRDEHSYMAPFYAFLLIVTALGILVFFYDRTIKQLGRSKKLLGRLRDLNGKLRQKNHELELYNKELDSFTYIASHDLKEPLRKIMTFSDMIAESEFRNFSEKNKTHFQRIQYAARRMQNLLDDLLLYSHATKSSLEFENVDLNSIVKMVEDNLAEEIKDSRTEINAERLPVVRGLPFQLKQLFENLITNSIKYKQENVPPQIHIQSSLVHKKELPTRFYKKSHQYYRIVFQDNGSGFQQTYAEKVFQLFQRVHTQEREAGTGIGLTICKKVVQNHNGFIRATSRVNRGTKFEIYFPFD